MAGQKVAQRWMAELNAKGVKVGLGRRPTHGPNSGWGVTLGKGEEVYIFAPEMPEEWQRILRVSREGTRRVTANLPASAGVAMQELCDDSGDNYTEVIAESLRTKRLLRKIEDEGGRLLVQYPDQTQPQLLRLI